jgi:cobalt/nickel transport system ATP-binding protein
MSEPSSERSDESPLEPLLEARGLSYRFATGQQALADVSLALRPGERVGLVGPNGAGKSTLLLSLTGVLRPSAGAIHLNGEEVTAVGLDELHRRVGLVFQHADDMLFTTCVRDDVAFGPRQRGLDPETVERRVTESLAAVGVGHLADRVPHHLSAGEKRAAAIASVLAMQPDLLLLDEPTSDLDPRGRRGLIRLLRGLGKTLLVASHDLEFVLALCKHVVVLDEGRVVASGPSREVLGDLDLMLAHGLERPHSLTPHAVEHEHEPDHGP